MTDMTRTAWAIAAMALVLLPAPAPAGEKKDTLVLGLILEPPGLDPTSGAAAAIGEVTHYNIYEGLAKITADGSVAPLLAQSWTVSPDRKTYRFKLRPGIRFQNGEPFTAAGCEIHLRARRSSRQHQQGEGRLRRHRRDRHARPAHHGDHAEARQRQFPVQSRREHRRHPRAQKRRWRCHAPVGTGPFTLESWVKGATITLAKWPGYRDAAAIRLDRVTFRIINDPAAQTAALLAGDVDAFPRFGALDSLKLFQGDAHFHRHR